MKKSLAFLFMLLVLVKTQAQIIPSPKNIIKSSASFNLDLPFTLTNNGNSKHEKTVLKTLPQVANSNLSNNSVKINLFPTYAAFIAELKRANLNFDFPNNPEGYVLQVTENQIQIFAFQDVGVFYAIQTLQQLLNLNVSSHKLPCSTIYDWPDIAIRAWQDDISRGPIPNMETLKQEIRTLAHYKLNYFTLYIEHVFKLDKHPTIAPKAGITKAELNELIAYANDYHVKLIGSYQSFGHLRKTLSNPLYAHLAENDHTISPALKESYDFLDDVYSEIVPSFNGEFFNINCDETSGLGEGKAKTMVDTLGMTGVYAYHINKLNGLLKKYHKKILMWGDIAAHHPEITANLPKDITVIPWAYHDAESFDYAIEPISKQGLNFWVAPGVSCWGNIYPIMETAKTNIYNLIRDGHKLGATGVLNTSWDDDGINFFNTTWHGFIWGAEISWNVPENLPQEGSNKLKEERYKDFNKSFDLQFYGLAADTNDSIVEVMKALSELHRTGIYHNLKNERFFEPIFPLHLDYVKEGQKEQNSTISKKIKALEEELSLISPKVKTNKATLPYLEYALQQVDFLSQKNIFRIDLYEYLKGNSAITVHQLKEQREDLIGKLEPLKQTYKALWDSENRAYWLNVNLEKFDALRSSLEKVGDYILIEPDIEPTKKGRKIELRSVFGDYPIKYTINGDSVTSTSTVYKNPFYVKGKVEIKAATDRNGEIGSVSAQSFIWHKAIGKLYKLNTSYSNYHPSYDGGGKYALVDGVLGDVNDIRSRKWQAYAGQDIDIELEFSGSQKLQTFAMGFFQNTISWVIFPKQVDIYIKNDEAENYTLYKTIKSKITPEEEGSIKEMYSTDLGGIKPKFIKIVAQNYGDLPAWHPAGTGNDSMLFADEITIE
ncbi:Chitobiase/beta-hexosaminidase C-terminal domain-containing protein [Spirosomataceae bacterium TFI 002]|nr:Chitobiase/beta-hexosaminidase C-terminal domain-containing protein [Spirosomataceae bacterium TFI 002]